jgi:hypothetical protein
VKQPGLAGASADYPIIQLPAYNRDRGQTSAFTLRLRGRF